VWRESQLLRHSADRHSADRPTLPKEDVWPQRPVG
jgi:hypothetical protein